MKNEKEEESNWLATGCAIYIAGCVIVALISAAVQGLIENAATIGAVGYRIGVVVAIVVAGVVGLAIIIAAFAAAWKARTPIFHIVSAPYVLLREYTCRFRHRPSRAVRKQIGEFKPRGGDPFPYFPLPSFEQVSDSCFKATRFQRAHFLYWLSPSRHAKERDRRAERRGRMAMYYRQLANGNKLAVSPIKREIPPLSENLAIWCSEFTRALTPQMIDFFCHTYLNDSISQGSFEQAICVLDEVIYRYACQVMVRGLYLNRTTHYSEINTNFTMDDFRTYLVRHVPISKSSMTLMSEYWRLDQLLLAAGQVDRNYTEPSLQVQAEKARQHEQTMKELELERERLAAERHRRERLQAMLDEISEVKARNFDQHVEDFQITRIREQYRDVDDSQTQ